MPRVLGKKPVALSGLACQSSGWLVVMHMSCENDDDSTAHGCPATVTSSVSLLSDSDPVFRGKPEPDTRKRVLPLDEPVAGDTPSIVATVWYWYLQDHLWAGFEQDLGDLRTHVLQDEMCSAWQLHRT